MTRVAIIGGGVGGLAAAIHLLAAGAEVEVYEQSPAPGEIGAGIILAPNAVRILDRMGLGAAVRSRACAATAHVFLRWSDASTIIREDYGADFVARFGSPSLSIHRGELVGILARAVPAARIHFGWRFTGLSQDAGTVTAHFAGGRTASADVLLGADGIKSSVAAAIGIPTVPRHSGLAAYRGLVPAAAVADLEIEPAWTGTLGPGGHFVHYFVSAGKLLNFVGIVPSAGGVESWTAEGDIRQARSFYAGWHDTVRGILARADRVTLWGLFDRPARENWSVGRAALLGDAAHPMLPTFAQGAAQALEDGAMLAALCGPAAARQIGEALTAYTALRLPRVRRIQDLARRNAVMFHLPDGPEQRERDARIATAAGGDPWRSNAWVYEYDPAEHYRRHSQGMAS
jgi:salicylate hydroxylase